MADGEDKASNFNLYRFVMGIVFYVWAAIFFVAPAYAGLKAPWSWGIYAFGIFWFVVGCVGFVYEVYGLTRRSEGFLLLFYVVVLFVGAASLHLATVYIPMGTGPVIVLRLIAVGLCLLLSLLLLLGLVGIIEALPAPTNRTDALLTLLALLGALLPIVVSIFSAP